MAARVEHLGEELLRIDAHLVEHEPRHVVARGRVGIDEAEVLALQVLDLLVGAVLLHVEDRVIALGAVGAHLDGEGFRLDARQQGAGEGCRAVHADMDVAGALAFDEGRVVIGDAQGDLGAEFLRQVGDEGTVTVGDAGGVLGRDHGEDEFGILGLPVLGQSGHGQPGGGGRKPGKHDAARDHYKAPSG